MAEKLRRGFAKEAEEYSGDYRRELGVANHEPLCPWRLADLLAIPVIALSYFRTTLPNDVKVLTGECAREFSAATLLVGTYRTIVHNDSHHLNRQRSTIAHELAHGILCHPASAILSEDCCRNFDPVLEREADYLGATLLCPRDAAMFILRNGWPLEEAAKRYGISVALVGMRLNLSGARTIWKRTTSMRRGLRGKS